MSETSDNDLLNLTAEIVSAHVANNSVHSGELAKLIASVHGALAGLGAPEAPAATEPEHKPAVGIRKSLANDEHIISMIDGKAYKTLRRHLRTHGLTDKEYRARYNLPADYPMVAKTYSAARAAMAQAIGLGRKAGKRVSQAAKTIASEVEAKVAPAAEPKRRVRKAKPAADAVPPSSAKRGRKVKDAAAT